ncbi:MAG: hypothetical protein IJI77_03400 [Erysipelotrichaceae bacterium]|nr:hypothetical protein [Erysipelotrichaceae bacterium]
MEKKKPEDMLHDGVLAYGVIIGRFVFENEFFLEDVDLSLTETYQEKRMRIVMF